MWSFIAGRSVRLRFGVCDQDLMLHLPINAGEVTFKNATLFTHSSPLLGKDGEKTTFLVVDTNVFLVEVEALYKQSKTQPKDVIETVLVKSAWPKKENEHFYSDLIAALRVGVLLLGTPPCQESGSVRDGMIISAVTGNSSVFPAGKSIFSPLWHLCDKDVSIFVQIMHQWAILWVKGAGTCTEIVHLNIEIVSDSQVVVDFAGIRKRQSNGQSEHIVRASGLCRFSN